jgi:hypothetical protein
MRCFFVSCLSLVCIAALPAAGVSQQREPVHIEQVRIGFQRIGPDYLFKAGAWTPVYVDLKAWSKKVSDVKLTVESIDSDDIRNRYTVTIPSLDGDEQLTVLTYTKPGSSASEITVSAEIEGRTVSTHRETYVAVDLGHQLYLGIGSRLPAFRQALQALANPSLSAEEVDVKEMGPRHLAVIDDVRSLPNRWFGHDPIDLAILTTSNRSFLTALLDDRGQRKEALVEWVRRGGRLIVTVGSQQDVVAKLEPITTVLPVLVTGIVELPRLTSVKSFSGADRALENPRQQPLSIAKLERKPGREIDVLLAEPNGQPIIVSGAYGRGRVTVVAFDVDAPPFTTWLASGQRGFWNKLRDLTAPAFRGEAANQPRVYGQQDTSDVASQLETNLEDFEDVPVISFGWVALFILAYILIVGPLDYFFLKKVVKRLELTWITFPTVVITISVAAYFTAYWLKGNDQKINKVDLVDIDLHTKQIYGNTWFTIFSPRIQHYTIGIEPGAGWAPAGDGTRVSGGAVVTWMSRPGEDFGGTNRARAQGLFRRAYDYASEAAGLLGVPIQVWSTKSFQVAWQAPDGQQAIMSANLRHPVGNPDGFPSGTITSRLPVALENAVLHYGRGGSSTWYRLNGNLLPGVPQRIDNIAHDGQDTAQWMQTLEQPAPAPNRPGRQATVASQTIGSIMKRILFYQGGAATAQRNATLQHLDQSWRLHYKDEVILYGRVARMEDDAESVTEAPGSPTRLWLGGLPAAGQPRPKMVGKLAQETFVRVIIPVSTPR